MPEANTRVIMEISLSEEDGVTRLVSLNLEQRKVKSSGEKLGKVTMVKEAAEKEKKTLLTFSR